MSVPGVVEQANPSDVMGALTGGGQQAGTSSWSWGESAVNPYNWDFGDTPWLSTTDAKTGITTQGKLGGTIAAAGAISNAYLGYKGLQEARKSREMQEKYASANLFNQAQGYNANVRDTGANNAAINSWSPERQQEYVQGNQAKSTVG